MQISNEPSQAVVFRTRIPEIHLPLHHLWTPSGMLSDHSLINKDNIIMTFTFSLVVPQDLIVSLSGSMIQGCHHKIEPHHYAYGVQLRFTLFPIELAVAP